MSTINVPVEPEHWLSTFCLLRTARKRHACACHIAEFHGEQDDGHGDFCNAYIEVGDRYVESLDSQPAYQSGERYCMACAKHNGSIMTRQPHRHGLECSASFMTQLSTDGRDCPNCAPGVPNNDYERLP